MNSIRQSMKSILSLKRFSCKAHFRRLCEFLTFPRGNNDLTKSPARCTLLIYVGLHSGKVSNRRRPIPFRFPTNSEIGVAEQVHDMFRCLTLPTVVTNRRTFRRAAVELASEIAHGFGRALQSLVALAEGKADVILGMLTVSSR